jgi:hypothetical protein
VTWCLGGKKAIYSSFVFILVFSFVTSRLGGRKAMQPSLNKKGTSSGLLKQPDKMPDKNPEAEKNYNFP